VKFLVLAYGAEADWKTLSRSEQTELLAADEVLRKRGDYVAAVSTDVTTVTAWEGTAKLTDGRFACSNVPLAGFGIIEAENLEEAISLVKDTPCARAKGAIELRPLLDISGT
jgi:hypothetical protein